MRHPLHAVEAPGPVAFDLLTVSLEGAVQGSIFELSPDEGRRQLLAWFDEARAIWWSQQREAMRQDAIKCQRATLHLVKTDGGAT